MPTLGAQLGDLGAAVGAVRIAFFQNAAALSAWDFYGVLGAENPQHLFAGRHAAVNFPNGVVQQGCHPGLLG